MKSLKTVFALTFACAVLAQPAMAQPPPATTAIVITIGAPVFESADHGQAPVGAATIGSTLRVIETMATEGWYRVNFEDAESGLRVRFIQMKDLRVLLPNSSRLLLWSSSSAAVLRDVQSWSGPIVE